MSRKINDNTGQTSALLSIQNQHFKMCDTFKVDETFAKRNRLNLMTVKEDIKQNFHPEQTCENSFIAID